MNVRVITGTDPETVVSLAAVKAHLVVTHTDDDVLIAAYRDAAVGHLDGPEGYLGRAIGEQTLELRLDSFGGDVACGVIALPYPPFVSLDSVKYLDGEGVEQTLATEVYEVTGPPGRKVLRAAYNQSWPTARDTAEAVRIQYAAGYETSPPAIVAAVLLMVGDLYANREPTVTGTIAAAIPMSLSVERLLAPFRVWSI